MRDEVIAESKTYSCGRLSFTLFRQSHFLQQSHKNQAHVKDRQVDRETYPPEPPFRYHQIVADGETGKLKPATPAIAQ